MELQTLLLFAIAVLLMIGVIYLFQRGGHGGDDHGQS